MLSDKIFPGEMQQTCRLTADRELTTAPSTDTTKVQFGELMHPIEITYRDMGDRLLRGAEVTQRQLNHQSPPKYG